MSVEFDAHGTVGVSIERSFGFADLYVITFEEYGYAKPKITLKQFSAFEELNHFLRQPRNQRRGYPRSNFKVR